MATVDQQLVAVKAEIAEVKAEIKCVTEQLAELMKDLAGKTGSEREEFLERERQLRKEKEDLRAKELVLLEERKQARLEQQRGGAMLRTHAGVSPLPALVCVARRPARTRALPAQTG